MTNPKKLIPINELHLEDTIQLCKQQQEVVLQKQNTHMLALLMRYVKIDVRRYALYSLIGFLHTLCITGFHPSFTLLYLSIYFFLLGLLAIYEFYKNVYYHTSELLSTVYVHPGRSLLMKNASIACIECILFFTSMMLPIFQQQITLTQGILCFLVPLYILQIAMMYLLPIIKGYSSAIILYVLLYGIYSIFVRAFSMLQISNSLSLLILASIMLIYLSSMYRFYLNTKKQGGNTYGIAIGTY